MITFKNLNEIDKENALSMFEILKEEYNAKDDEFELWYENSIINAKPNVILMYEDEKLISFLEYLDKEDSCFICELQISKDHRGDKKTLKGIYAHLLEVMNEKKTFEGRINPSNNHSIDVHTHLGFKLKDEAKHLYSCKIEDLKSWIQK